MTIAASLARWLLAALLAAAVLAAADSPLRAARGQTPTPAANQPALPPAVHLLPVRGAIGPATAAFIARGLSRAADARAQLVVMTIDTPGGLDSAMRDIIRAILASPVPVATFVYPGGARAASAGTYILYASHIAAMAPGTNLGAASPVSIGLGGDGSRDRTPERRAPAPGDASGAKAAPAPGEPTTTMERKQLHDAVAYLRGLAELRGRNPDWAERAVREAVSLPASEALAQNVIDLVADDVPALLRALDGRRVPVAGQVRTLRTADAALVEQAPDWRIRLLAVLTEPSVALILMMIGIYGLLFEFSTPGAVLPGVVGAICLLLGLFALQMLPVNYAGLALIALGIGCMVAEAWLPSFGVLGLGGVVAFALGAVMLIEPDTPGFGIPLALVATLSLAAAALSFGVSAAALQARRRPVVIDDTRLGSAVATMLDAEWAQVQGERWRVQSPVPLIAGQPVRVLGRDGLLLRVEPLPAPSDGTAGAATRPAATPDSRRQSTSHGGTPP